MKKNYRDYVAVSMASAILCHPDSSSLNSEGFSVESSGPALLHITIDSDVCLGNIQYYNESGWQNRVKSVLDSTEPAWILEVFR